ncbi:MAG: PQQ-binding-like beta-propeller repeat protein [Nitrososphaerota archaeon]|nr:PQQ-binding-like beta-propeller repeat protein [Candidatus Bathyarchaeota archaeon]MDW8049128.1 PQQ-binding-like beta-propeller repeat protein [Nitrososphaerota archaeon]
MDKRAINNGAAALLMGILLASTIALLAKPSLGSQLILYPWPMGGRSISRTNYTPASGPVKNETAWTFQTGGPIRSGVAVVGGVVYVGSNDGCLYALNLTNGKMIWKFQTAGNVTAEPAVADGRVYFLSTETPPNLYCLEAATGKRLWNYSAIYGGAIYCGPAIDGGRVVFNVGMYVYCVNATSGEPIWSPCNLHDNPIVGGVTIYGDRIYVGNDRNMLYVVYMATGTWTAGDRMALGGDFAGYAVISEGLLYVAMEDNLTIIFNLATPLPHTEVRRITIPDKTHGIAVSGTLLVVQGRDRGSLYAYNSSTGDLLWSFTVTPSATSWTFPIISGNGLVYFAAVDGYIYALDARSGRMVWSYRTNATAGTPLWAIGAVVDDRFIIGHEDGVVYCFGKKAPEEEPPVPGEEVVYEWPMGMGNVYRTGYTDAKGPVSNKTLWTFRTGGPIRSGVAVAGGIVYVGSDDNCLYAINLTTGEQLWKFETGHDVRSDPAVADGMVYFGSRDRTFYCLNATTGALIWNFTTPFELYGGSVVAGGRVIFGTRGNGTVYCLDSKTGRLIWSAVTGRDIRGGPAISEGKVLIGNDDDRVYMIDFVSGVIERNVSMGADIYRYVVVSGDLVLVVNQATDGRIGIFSLPTLASVRNITGVFKVRGGLAVAGGVAYLAGREDGVVQAFNITTGEQIWNFTTGVTGSWYSLPVVSGNGLVYFAAMNGQVYALDAKTGKIVWSYLTEKTNITECWAHGAIVNNRLIIGHEDGVVYCFGEILVTLRVTLQWTNSTAISGAEVTIAGQTKQTNASGVAVFNFTSGVYKLTVKYMGVTMEEIANLTMYYDRALMFREEAGPYERIILLNSQISSLQSQISSLNSQIGSLQGQVSSLQGQVSSWQTQASNNLYMGLGAGVVVGLIVGFAVAFMLRRKG